MLVAIVVLFLVTELPQGALALCSGLVEHCFQSYYAPLGDTMDIVALVNNGINFALYCTMSARFRQTFASLITPSRPLGRRRRSPTADDLGGNGVSWQPRGSQHDEVNKEANTPVSPNRRENATWNMTTPVHESQEMHDHLEIYVMNQH